MWIGTDLGLPTERYYPKYPLGLPVLVAIAMKIGGTTLPYWINPIAMTLAVAATFLLIRQVLGSFPALMGMLIFATSPVTLALTNDTNSHATTVCCVTWGMYFCCAGGACAVDPFRHRRGISARLRDDDSLHRRLTDSPAARWRVCIASRRAENPL